MLHAKKRKSWDQADMSRALDAVNTGAMSVSSASRKFKIPRMTLSDIIYKNMPLDASMGRPRAITTEEEASLVKYKLYTRQASPSW